MAIAELMVGIFVMAILGASVGNYATSLVYRLPRNLKILNIAPYCECEKKMFLQVRDNFPILSWLMSRGTCRWCTNTIPALYLFVEIGCALVFIGAWLMHGVSEHFLLNIGLGVFLVTLCALYYAEQRLFPQVYIAVAAFSAVLRTLEDGTIYGMVQGGYLALMFGIAIWVATALFNGRKLPFPAYAAMLGLGGWCNGKDGLLAFLILSVLYTALVWVAGCRLPKLRSACWILGVSLAVMLGALQS